VVVAEVGEAEAEVPEVGHEQASVEEEESVRRDGVGARGRRCGILEISQATEGVRVGRLSFAYATEGVVRVGGGEGCEELPFGEDGTQVVRVSARIRPGFARRVNIVPPSERIRLSAEAARTVTDDVVESGEVFGPAGLSARELFGGGEVFQRSVIRDGLDLVLGTLEVRTPHAEAVVDGKEFLVVDFVVELSGLERS
jgi:hypothetical protein